jgi:transcriptional regulator with XRE-family HTH domain
MTFGDKVKQARESLGWTQRRLAEEAGLSLQLIEHLETRGELMLEIPQTLTLIERAFKRFKVSVTVDD